MVVHFYQETMKTMAFTSVICNRIFEKSFSVVSLDNAFQDVFSSFSIHAKNRFATNSLVFDSRPDRVSLVDVGLSPTAISFSNETC